MNKLTASITLSSSVQVRVPDKSLVNSLEGTVVWEYNLMAFPQMSAVQLYKSLMKIYTNMTNIQYMSEAPPWWSIRTRTRLLGLK
jgi:hypothetical protein